MRESYIENWAVDYAKAGGWFVRKVQWVGHRDAPDRLFARSAFSFWAEFKATGEKPRISQLREHERMRAAGLKVFVIDSIETARALLA